MAHDLLFGIQEAGVMHTDADPVPDLETRFSMVKDAGVYDYYDKTPPSDQVNAYQRCAERYDLPVLAGGWYYTLGKDEDMLAQNLRIGAALGSRVHNTQIKMDHADGHLVTDQEVADAYLRAYDIGAKVNCLSTFEVHVNMWSEDFRRVAKVADMVAERGIPFHMTLDHSHVIFKIDNPREQKVFGIDEAVEDGSLILDPFTSGNVCDIWIERGFVAHCHARAAAPNNPRNVRASHPDLDSLPSSLHPQDTTGRGIQYPFIEPGPGEWHAEWDEDKLEPWKEVMRHLFADRAARQTPTFDTVTTEFIPFPDYGGGAGYSIFEHSVACARWLREAWQAASAGTEAAQA